MKISKHSIVSIHYELTNDSGETLDSSEGQDPLTYLHGTGSLIPGLERELEGKQVGDDLTAVITPADGYGEQDDALIRDIPRSAFGDVDDLSPGMQFQGGGEGEAPQVFTITKITGDQVTVDGNHPLAGMTLKFDVSIESIRDATPEELDHGHVH
ncbi:MAG: peptidylprolyl isomerase [Pseudomonadales bacterium]|nr:peptidylprolyl isomerase [Pseudomonadales bacterium]